MKRFIRAGAALPLALALVLAACAGNGGSGGENAASEAVSDTEAADDGEPRTGGVLNTSVGSDVRTSLDPHSSTFSSMYYLLTPSYNKLLDVEGDPADELTIVPDLAAEWDVSDDGLTYTFNLRDDVVWHDIEPVNGRPFVADDVVATYERIMDVALQGSWFANVESIEAPDDHTVIFELSEPFAPFLEAVAHHYNVILPREGVEGEYDLETQIIGTGPFILETWNRDVEYLRVRNPHYFEEGKPYLDELNTLILPEQAARQSALRSGRLNHAPFTDLGLADPMEAEGFGRADEMAIQSILWLNEEVEPYNDPRVRRAIALAIDWDGMGEGVRGRYQRSALIGQVAGSAALPEDEVRELTPHDPEQARELLAEAGYPDGFSTELLVLELSEVDVQEAVWMEQDLADIGIDVELTIADLPTAVDRRRAGDFEMTKGLNNRLLAEEYVEVYFPEHLDNISNVDDAELREMIERTRRELDEAARIEIYHDIQRHMIERGDSALQYQYYDFHVFDENVRDFQPFLFRGARTWADVWLAS